MAHECLFTISAILPNGEKKMLKKVEPSPDRHRLEAQAQQLSLTNKKGIRYVVEPYAI